VEWPGHHIAHWRIRSATGALLKEGRQWSAPLDLGELRPGVLLVELWDVDGARGILRVVKE
jgi:hypothetical protein